MKIHQHCMHFGVWAIASEHVQLNHQIDIAFVLCGFINLCYFPKQRHFNLCSTSTPSMSGETVLLMVCWSSWTNKEKQYYGCCKLKVYIQSQSNITNLFFIFGIVESFVLNIHKTSVRFSKEQQIRSYYISCIISAKKLL